MIKTLVETIVFIFHFTIWVKLMTYDEKKKRFLYLN